MGEILHHVERFRVAVADCYDAYNQSCEKLRGLVGHVSATAGTVRAASEQMSCTSEEAGKATGEIALAIGEIAAGAERQARMASDAKRSAEEIAHAVAESAENAERTAEVANNAHLAAKEGLDAAEKAKRRDAVGQGLQRQRQRDDLRAGCELWPDRNDRADDHRDRRADQSAGAQRGD
jgi:methyl-accepting chemotaxis protein